MSRHRKYTRTHGHRVFASTVINNHQYWHRHVPVQKINNYKNIKEVGDVASLRGKLDIYNHDVFLMKEQDYTMKLMFTYCGLTMKNDQKEIYKDNHGDTKTTKFKYKELF